MLLRKDILGDYTISLDTLSDIHWFLLLKFAKASKRFCQPWGLSELCNGPWSGLSAGWPLMWSPSPQVEVKVKGKGRHCVNEIKMAVIDWPPMCVDTECWPALVDPTLPSGPTLLSSCIITKYTEISLRSVSEQHYLSRNVITMTLCIGKESNKYYTNSDRCRDH